MNKIAPSVMCIDLLDLEHQIRCLDDAGVDSYHIDIMDGHYVPNFALNPDVMHCISRVSKTPMDVHIMATNPTEYIAYFADAGAHVITPHLETLEHPIRTLRQIRSLGKQAGIAINPATGLTSMAYLMEYLDLICVMTVDPGFAGQQMIPETLGKIQALREMADASGKEIDIMVDGQVKDETAASYVRAGANMLVLGSSGLFCHPCEAYRQVIQGYRSLTGKEVMA